MRSDKKLQDGLAGLGLDRQKLAPVVERIAGEPVASFDVQYEHSVGGHGGYSAPKSVPTFTYTTASGRTGRTIVFAKAVKGDAAEPRNYAYLHDCNLPIPRLFGIVPAPAEPRRTVLFLEHLQVVEEVTPWRQFFSRAESVAAALEALAAFNAFRPHGSLTGKLRRRTFIPDADKTAKTIEDLRAAASRGELGRRLGDFCRQDAERLVSLPRLCADLARQVAGMKTGLLHGDFHPAAVGWRKETGQALIQDLETVCIGPRFFDVADWLGMPEEFLALPRDRGELAQAYLAAYARAGGDASTSQSLLEDAGPLRLCHLLTKLWFVLEKAINGEADFTDDHEEGRRIFQSILLEQLRELVSRL